MGFRFLLPAQYSARRRCIKIRSGIFNQRWVQESRAASSESAAGVTGLGRAGSCPPKPASRSLGGTQTPGPCTRGCAAPPDPGSILLPSRALLWGQECPVVGVPTRWTVSPLVCHRAASGAAGHRAGGSAAVLGAGAGARMGAGCKGGAGCSGDAHGVQGVWVVQRGYRVLGGCTGGAGCSSGAKGVQGAQGPVQSRCALQSEGWVQGAGMLGAWRV